MKLFRSQKQYDSFNKSLCEKFGVEYTPDEMPDITIEGESVPSWSKGLNLTEDHKKKISESRLGEKHWMFGKKHSDEYKKKMSDSMIGKNTESKSYEHRLKISKTLRGRNPNWKEVTCPHCSKIGKENNMYRWHFDNCKHKTVVSVQQMVDIA